MNLFHKESLRMYPQMLHEQQVWVQQVDFPFNSQAKITTFQSNRCGVHIILSLHFHWKKELFFFHRAKMEKHFLKPNYNFPSFLSFHLCSLQILVLWMIIPPSLSPFFFKQNPHSSLWIHFKMTKQVNVFSSFFKIFCCLCWLRNVQKRVTNMRMPL